MARIIVFLSLIIGALSFETASATPCNDYIVEHVDLAQVKGRSLEYVGNCAASPVTSIVYLNFDWDASYGCLDVLMSNLSYRASGNFTGNTDINFSLYRFTGLVAEQIFHYTTHGDIGAAPAHWTCGASLPNGRYVVVTEIPAYKAWDIEITFDYNGLPPTSTPTPTSTFTSTPTMTPTTPPTVTPTSQPTVTISACPQSLTEYFLLSDENGWPVTTFPTEEYTEYGQDYIRYHLSFESCAWYTVPTVEVTTWSGVGEVNIPLSRQIPNLVWRPGSQEILYSAEVLPGGKVAASGYLIVIAHRPPAGTAFAQ